MAGIYVDTAQLHGGAESCVDAAGWAKDAASRLGAAPAAGIFGDFDAAHAFHATLSDVHDTHRDDLHGHHRTLTGLSGKARSAAAQFEGTDDSAAGEINDASDHLG